MLDKTPILDIDTLSYSLTPKDNPKDMVQVEIGDSKDATVFQPQVKIMRWDNEVNLSYRLITDEKADEVVTQEDETIVWDKGNYQVKTYDLPISEENPEGGQEFEVILKDKPKTNVIEFSLNTKGLDFFYQPALTQEEIDQGASRPENVVGSYAVYASENKTNYVGGKEYKCGKVGHIFRPKIIDSAGMEVWGELHIENGILSVTIPQDFLDKAVYPIRHAAGLTFGLLTSGASNAGIAYNTSDLSLRVGTVYACSGNYTLTQLTAWIKCNAGTEAVDVIVYINDEDSGGAGTHGQIVSAELLNQTFTTTAVETNFNPGSTALTANNYILNILGNGEDVATAGTLCYVTFDTTGTQNNYNENSSGAGSYAARKENPWVAAVSSTNRQHSIYATYTAAASGPANLKSRSGNLKANIKSMSGNLIANIKSLSGNS